MLNRVATGAIYHCYFNPERDMPIEAENVHGLSIAFLSDKPKFAEKAEEFLEFIGESPLVAHNAGFDFGFINTELVKCGLQPVSRDRMIDTVAIARRKHPGAKLSLDALCSRYGIDRSHRTKHGALLDAELLAQLYVELQGGRQIGLELAVEAAMGGSAIVTGSVATTETVMFAAANTRLFRSPRPHAASAQELVRHAEFMAGFSEPIWSR